MSNVEFTSKIDVELIQECASDDAVVQAMLVSTQGRKSLDASATEGRINFLMSKRHGTPFEHTFFTFFVDAPIMVFREFHRHRIGWSYNEESGRYAQLRPKFYLPEKARVQKGKPGHYIYEDGDDIQYGQLADRVMYVCKNAYANYEALLVPEEEDGVGLAREQARILLPVNIFSSMYATCNARSLMSFLSLRQKHEQRVASLKQTMIAGEFPATTIEWKGEAMFPSYPMKEINIVADAFETYFRELMPITHAAFVANGYVAP